MGCWSISNQFQRPPEAKLAVSDCLAFDVWICFSSCFGQVDFSTFDYSVILSWWHTICPCSTTRHNQERLHRFLQQRPDFDLVALVKWRSTQWINTWSRRTRPARKKPGAPPRNLEMEFANREGYSIFFGLTSMLLIMMCLRLIVMRSKLRL